LHRATSVRSEILCPVQIFSRSTWNDL